jgi:hypothetical protein
MANCVICGKPASKGQSFCPRCGSNVFSSIGKPFKSGSSKYKNNRIDTTDGTFDSQLEYRRWQELKLLERAKHIKDLERQVKFVLVEKSKYGGEIRYMADFVYIDLKTNEKVVEDTKSEATKTPLYRLKKRLLAEKSGLVIKETTSKDVKR